MWYPGLPRDTRDDDGPRRNRVRAPAHGRHRACAVAAVVGGSAWPTASTSASRIMTRVRVPFIQQLGVDDCGATCLAMVLAAHGVHDVASECRALCGAGRDGARLTTLANVAERYGLECRIARVAPGDIAMVPLPAVAHWRSSHFVVVERCSSRN